MSALYRVINPAVKLILNSPVHRILSRNTMTVSFVGRKSGQRFCLPISYANLDGAIVGFTGREGRWWRNFADGGEAKLLITGRTCHARVEAKQGSEHNIEALLAGFLTAVPRDAGFAGVGMVKGVPDRDDVAAAAGRLVALRFELQNTST